MELLNKLMEGGRDKQTDWARDLNGLQGWREVEQGFWGENGVDTGASSVRGRKGHLSRTLATGVSELRVI
jgi:hypothetical protein